MNSKFKKKYDELFKEDPLSANILLLFLEIADEKCEVCFDVSEISSEDQIMILLKVRFNDPMGYQL